MASTLAYPILREAPAGYSAPPEADYVYEVTLRTPPERPWLGDILNAHRLAQTWLLAQSKGWGKLLSIAIRPGVFTLRASLGKETTLAEFCGYVREKSTPPHQTVGQSWAPEPEGLRGVSFCPPQRLDPPA